VKKKRFVRAIQRGYSPIKNRKTWGSRGFDRTGEESGEKGDLSKNFTERTTTSFDKGRKREVAGGREGRTYSLTPERGKKKRAS